MQGATVVSSFNIRLDTSAYKDVSCIYKTRTDRIGPMVPKMYPKIGLISKGLKYVVLQDSINTIGYFQR
uniref:Uncharacterized protein n=1 Tax=Octopus bimaculoides TaxID=37653 RepID=A0A0L8GRI0_OCTBM